MIRIGLLASAFLCFAFTSNLHAENWGHWRGSTGNGVSLDAKPPTSWSETENVKWKVAIPGRGSGSPIVWADRVFVVTAVNSGSVSGNQSQSGSRSTLDYVVMCFARGNGALLWKQVAATATPHEGKHSTNGYASASPCTDGKHLYAHFGSRGLYCYTMGGELKWSRTDFPPMTTRGTFGEGSSPTLAGNLVIVPWDHEGSSFLYGLDKLTGKTVWKVERDEPSCWATPFVIAVGGKTQIVMNGQTSARSYDVETGNELWRCGGQTQRPVASAVGANGIVYVGSGFRGSFLGAFRVNGSGDIEGTKAVAWSVDRDTPDIASPLLSDGRLYYHKGKSGLLTCLDAVSGKPHYTATRIPEVNSTYASPIAAGGHVYLTGRGGNTVVIEDSDQLQIVSTNSLGEPVDATPAAVGNELFIRGQNHLFCISK